GPQGGMIYTNREDIFEKISNKLAWHTLDNAHQHRIAALGQTFLECSEFGKDYARQVIKNSKALAHALIEVGIPAKFGFKDYTESHQILLDIVKIKTELGLNSMEFMTLLEDENIIVDAVGRLGTNEMTRCGCSEDDMITIAEFIKRIIIRQEKNVKEGIEKFLKKLKLSYCF
ncbi:MAG: serine hydroxymethyltransferase, partial [Thermoplasmata archaeon]|nr:serine hydroxymethyltransferase [Thermoplasmata archaeon]